MHECEKRNKWHIYQSQWLVKAVSEFCFYSLALNESPDLQDPTQPPTFITCVD
jgi:hypothetical protein